MSTPIRFVVGIDPGKFGGLCILSRRNGAILCLSGLPDSFFEFQRLLDRWAGAHETLVFIEDETSSPGSSPASAFTFGMEFQRCLDAAWAYELAMVRPIEWQCKMGCRTKGDKSVSLLAAQKLFPAHVGKLDNATADASLIAAYGLERIKLAEKYLVRSEISIADYRDFELQFKKRD